MKKIILVLGIIGMSCFCEVDMGFAQGGAGSDVMQKLQQFLMNPADRAKFAKGRPDAEQANNFAESFPPYALQEILEITMMMMRENQGRGFTNGMSPSAAVNKMSPDVRKRMQALKLRLESDPNFNNRQNMNHMKHQVPNIYKKQVNGSVRGGS